LLNNINKAIQKALLHAGFFVFCYKSYTNDKPILTINSSKSDVKITNSFYFEADYRSFGVLYDKLTSQLEVVADNASIVENPSIK